MRFLQGDAVPLHPLPKGLNPFGIPSHSPCPSCGGTWGMLEYKEYILGKAQWNCALAKYDYPPVR